MHVVRYLGYAALAIITFAVAAINQYPGTDFAHFTGQFLLWGSLILLAVAGAALLLEDRVTETGKTLVMTLFLLTIFIPTIYATGSFIHEDQTSWSNGEVHYHADYTVLIQTENGEYVQPDLIDPGQFCEDTQYESTYMCELNDRTGSIAYHEHDDNRIHLEGVFRTRDEATLAAFFETFDGTLTNTELVYPTADTTWRVQDGDGKTVKTLLKRGVGGTRGWCALSDQVPEEDICRDSYTNDPATSPAEYVISPYQQGDTLLDHIWIIYDDNSVSSALNNLRATGNYTVTVNGELHTFTLAGEKTSEGY